MSIISSPLLLNKPRTYSSPLCGTSNINFSGTIDGAICPRCSDPVLPDVHGI